jgi:hypothetical protein
MEKQASSGRRRNTVRLPKLVELTRKYKRKKREKKRKN